ncbi:hypothetical protein vseg_000304 [Gypsophila vaccaria]
MGEYRSKSYSDGRMEIERYRTDNTNNKNNYISVWETPDTNTANNSTTVVGGVGVWENPDTSTANTNGVGVGGVGVGFQDLRCYSASYATSNVPKEGTKQKGSSSTSSKAVWCFGDPELQRKRRVASYKSYSVEGRLKRSLSKSFRWIKDRCHA